MDTLANFAIKVAKSKARSFITRQQAKQNDQNIATNDNLIMDHALVKELSNAVFDRIDKMDAKLNAIQKGFFACVLPIINIWHKHKNLKKNSPNWCCTITSINRDECIKFSSV